MGKILWLVVLIIVVVALYNTFTHLSSSFKFENLGSIIRLPGSPIIRTTSTVSVPTETSTGGVGSAPSPAVQTPSGSSRPQIVPPTGFTAGQLSPHYGQVKIGYPSQTGSNGPSQFSVRADYSLLAPIDITGWSIESNGGILSFPKAVSDYKPSGLAPDGDIILNKNDGVTFYSNFVPIGTGLRLNKCTGYLNSSIQFIPQLPNNCPSMYERSEITSFSGACQNLLQSLWGCSVPTLDQINSLPYSDTDCRALLLTRLNYNSCYSRYHNDVDFFSNEWRVWLRTKFNFDWTHDRLVLLDRNNLVVDVYNY